MVKSSASATSKNQTAAATALNASIKKSTDSSYPKRTRSSGLPKPNEELEEAESVDSSPISTTSSPSTEVRNLVSNEAVNLVPMNRDQGRGHIEYQAGKRDI